MRTNMRNYFISVVFFCCMADINKIICDYITNEWLEPWLDSNKSQRAFADYHNVEESIIRKIKGTKEYRIPVETLQKICDSKNITLSAFFKLIKK